MLPVEWFGMLCGAALAVGVLLLARAGLRGEWLRREQHCTLVCPRLERMVECGIVQDIRTGQWKQVHTCSAFGDDGNVLCGQECAQLMNLGVRMPTTVRA